MNLDPWAYRLRGLDGIEAPVVVACSGGADSLALLALAAARGLAPVALHVDHGLRPGADRERRGVRAAAERLGAGADGVRVAVLPGPNLEARARDARYAALEQARARLSANAVLVGHTADDQAETVLLNFLRGSGSAGLAGMRERRGAIVRPLLDLRRADTVEICARLAFAPVRDPMNEDARFRRVWLRREVLPLLEQAAGRDLVPLLARQAGLAAVESDFLDSSAAAAWPGRDAIPRAAGLTGLPLALQRRCVRRWIGTPPPASGDVDAVLGVARGERRAAELSGRRRVRRRGGVLHLETAAPGFGSRTVRLPGLDELPGWRVESWIEREAPVRWPDRHAAAVLDADRAGEAALAVFDDRTVALRAPDGTPLWELGYGVAARARAAPETRRYLWITAERLT